MPKNAATEGESSTVVIGAPALTGRAHELAALTRALGSPPTVVAVEGEAGIGKSRLLSEFLASSAAPERFLLASCPPYREPHTLGAVVDAVRQVAVDVPKLPLSRMAGALRSVFPEWAGQLPPPVEPAEDATAARHRLFLALADLLCCLDVELLAVEDVHWADDATLEFLLFLITRRPQALSVVMTYRPEDFRPDSLVRRLLSRLPVGSGALRLTLGPLDIGETSELVSSMLAGQQVSADYAEFLHRHTDGIPLAIEESVRLMHERADLVQLGRSWVRNPLRSIEVPPTVRDVVLERVQRLGPDALTVVRAAAVFAEPTDESMLLAVAGLPAERGSAALATLLGARLLRQDRFGFASFRHALSGQAIYEAIPASELRALHRRAGEVLQAISPPPLAQLTRHFRGAGDAENWCRYGELAADRALASGDDATAGAILYDLLTSASLEPQAVVRVARKLPLAVFSGPAHNQGLISTLRSALTAPGLGRENRADLRYELGRTLMMVDYEAGRLELERAIPNLGHDPAAHERALMLLAWRSSSSPTWLRRRWVNRAAAVTVPSRGAGERLRIFVDRISTLLTLGDASGWQLANQLPATVSSTAERLQLARAGLNLGHLAMVWGRYGEARSRLAAALDLAERCGYGPLHDNLLTSQTHLDWFTGSWAGLAERAAALEANNDLLPVARLEAVLVAGLLEIATARPGADAGLGIALARVGQRGAAELSMEIAGALARLHLGTGSPSQALEVTDAVSTVLARTGAWVWATDLMPARIQALLEVGHLDDASKLVAAFGRGLADRDAPAPGAALVLCRAMLADARGQHSRAAAGFARAAGAWQALPRPFDAALAREQQASCLIAAGQIPAGVALLSQAFDALSGLGATAHADRLARCLRENGVAVPRIWAGGRRGYGDRLSPRELDVVRLVAGGRTNREIAAALYRSTETVATQLRSAMRKLGVASRAALAVRAIETGVLRVGARPE